jgi:Ca2+-transporting ATPase
MEYYGKTLEEALKELQSDSQQGLSQLEADKRLAQFGLNQLEAKKQINPWGIFLEQFKAFLIWVLIGAALISGFLGEWGDTIAIIAIVILNAILGFIQEYKAEKSLAALRKLTFPVSKVIRNGQSVSIPSSHLVPGDVIELEAGDSIPADARLLWVSSQFTAQEASLTGESNPVAKNIQAITDKEVPLAERANMVFMGTSVASGKGKALVIATGMKTSLGEIASLVQEIRHEITPLQRKLEVFGKWIVYLCFVLVGIILLMEWFRGGAFIQVFMTAVSLAVAAIPEGLPAVVTIALALGVHRMVKRHVLIRKLPSVETLGCATVICSDKTGTLTRNEMTVKQVYAGGELFTITGTGYEPEGEFLIDGKPVPPEESPVLLNILHCAVLCNNAHLVKGSESCQVIGDPTEGALLTLAGKASITKDSLEEESSFLDEIPFDSERKLMTVVRLVNQQPLAYVKGAPDVLLKKCAWIETPSGIEPFTSIDRLTIEKINNEMANQALRVLGFAYKKLDEVSDSYETEKVESELTFLGLIAMIDPPREEVKAAIQDCKTAGIKAVMITGDHKNTAVAIAKELGIYAEGSLALSGTELDHLTQDELLAKVREISVYARVSPEHKLRVVDAWKKHGEIVAMTGDGVNDAPAVKEADIGVAMGITGTDVTKEVSDMVVTDDNFASIVSAVEEGRGIYDNIKKFIHYLLSCNTSEILVMFIASLFGYPVPLLPIQILWINLVTDGLPALALGMDPVEPNIMKRHPRSPTEAVVTRHGIFMMVIQGIFITICTLTAYFFVLYVEKAGIQMARTTVLMVLATSQLFHAFNCRSMRISLFKLGIFTNMKLIYANLASFALLLIVVYFPGLRFFFKTSDLSLFQWFLILGLSSLPLWAMELWKLVGWNLKES